MKGAAGITDFGARADCIGYGLWPVIGLRDGEGRAFFAAACDCGCDFICWVRAGCDCINGHLHIGDKGIDSHSFKARIIDASWLVGMLQSCVLLWVWNYLCRLFDWPERLYAGEGC